eukprot:242292_1
MMSDTRSPIKKKGKISLRPGGGLRSGRSLRAQAKTSKDYDGPRLKDQAGPRHLYAIEELFGFRDANRAYLVALPRIFGVTGLGLGLQDDLTRETWDENERRDIRRGSVDDSSKPVTEDPRFKVTKTETPKVDKFAGNVGESGSPAAKVSAASEPPNESSPPADKPSDRPATEAKTERPRLVLNKPKETATAPDVTPAPVSEKPAPKTILETVPSKKAWVPNRNKNLSPAELLDSKITGLLNKITAVNFNSLAEQIVDWSSANVDNAELLGLLTKLVHGKAVSEENFVRMYAGLCTRLQEELPSFGESTFRRSLLNICQSDFQKGSRDLDHDSKSKDAMFQRKIVMGNITFIGELFKVDLLSEKIMHACIQHLIRNTDPSDDECEQICNLMTTIGHKLDSSKHKKYTHLMNDYFKRFKGLALTEGQSPRSKFLLLDLIDLRKQNWVDSEQRELTAVDAQKPDQHLDDIDKIADNAPSSDSILRELPTSEIGGGSYKSGVEAPTVAVIEGTVDRYGRSRKMGADKSPYRGPVSAEVPDIPKFDSSRTNQSQNFSLLPTTSKPLPKKPKPSPKVAKPQKSSAKVASTSVSLSAEEVRKLEAEIVKMLFDEPNIAAVEKAFLKLCYDDVSLKFVDRIINMSLDKDGSQRLTVSKCIVEFVEKKHCSREDVQKVLVDMLEPLRFEDMYLDYPKYPSYMGEIVGVIFLNGSLSYELLVDLVKSIRQVTDKRILEEEFLGSVLKMMLQVDKNRALDICRKSTCDIAGLIRDPSKFEDFLQQYGVSELTSAN